MTAGLAKLVAAAQASPTIGACGSSRHREGSGAACPTGRLVRQAGFTCAVTTGFGLNTRHTSPWELQRGGPWEHDLPTFALKLATLRLRGA